MEILEVLFWLGGTFILIGICAFIGCCFIISGRCSEEERKGYTVGEPHEE